MSEEAKATQEVAKATGKALDRAGEMGGWLDKVFGDLVVDGVGVVADKLKYYRIEKALLLRDKVEKRLKDKGISATIPVPPRIGVKLIEEATVSDDDSLHTKWANLLANAMDPTTSSNVKRKFVSILADLEAIDARLLDTIMEAWQQIPSVVRKDRLIQQSSISQHLKIGARECELSIRNLMRLGLIKPGVITITGVQAGGHATTAYKDAEMFSPTVLGEEFYDAVN